MRFKPKPVPKKVLDRLKPKHHTLLEHPFGIVKKATTGSYLITANHLIENDNEPMRVMHLEESGLSDYAIGDFVDFGRAFGLVQEVPLPEINRVAFQLTDPGQQFYQPLTEWEARLRAGF